MKSRRLILFTFLPSLLLGSCVGNSEDTPEPAQQSKTQAVVAAPDPTAKPYYNYFEQQSGKPETWNFQSWEKGARTIQIAAKRLVLDAADTTTLASRFNDRLDVRRLDIYAETVVVRRRIWLPGTEVHIHAQELRFEDVNGARSMIETTPVSLSGQPAFTIAGADGLNAGDIYAAVKTFYSDGNFSPRFVMNGGNGQPGGAGAAGINGTPRTKLSSANPGLLSCASTHGITAPPDFDGLHQPFYFDPGVSLAELQFNTVNLGLDFPSDGTPATAGGKHGNAGNAGKLHVLAGASLGSYIQANAGQGAGNAGFYAGGNSGKPDPAVKLASAKCDSWCYTLDFGDGGTVLTCDTRLVVTGVEKRDILSGASAQSPSADIPTGSAGTTNADFTPFAWYHPHAVAMTIAFAEDAFATDFRDLATTELTNQDTLLTQLAASTTWATLSDADRALFTQDALRVRSLLNQLASHEDYWGNPSAWVPELSLEANVALYQQEVGWAIRTIFVSDWLTDTSNAAKDKAAALTQAKGLLTTEIAQLQAQFDAAVASLPGLKVDASNAVDSLAQLGADLEGVDQRLTERATEDVQARQNLPFWKKALKVLFVVARALPIPAVQPELGGAAAALDALINFDSDKPWDTLAKVPDVVGAFKDSSIDKAAKDVKDKTAADKPGDKTTKGGLQAAVADIQKYVGPVVSALKTQKDLFKGQEVKKEELDKQVAAELEKLKGQDEEYNAIVASVKNVTDSRDQLVKSIAATTTTLEQAATGISAHWLELAELLPQLDGTDASIASQRALIALGDMRAKAVRRLQKYQYLLARSYEYRMLHKYQGDLTLTNLFNQMLTMVRASGETGVLQSAEYDQLYTLYRNEISAIVEEVVDGYSSGQRRYDTISVNYTLSADELAQLNTGGSVDFNFWDRGAFRDTDEDVRIVSFAVTDMQVDQVGTGDFAYLDLDTHHNGMSRVWRDGQVSVFQHYNKQTLQPLHWATRWEAGTITQHQPSASSESLLHALLPNASADILLFSRPSAWAKLSMQKLVHGTNGVNFNVRSATVRLTYDYTSSVTSKRWTQYRDTQNATINGLYQSLLARPATSAELGDARELLDVGYATADLQGIIIKTHNQEYLGLKVTGFYQALYTRAPTTAERDFWANQLVAGRPEAQVKDYIKQVTDAYKILFHRTPTYDELQAFIDGLDQG